MFIQNNNINTGNKALFKTVLKIKSNIIYIFLINITFIDILIYV